MPIQFRQEGPAVAAIFNTRGNIYLGQITKVDNIYHVKIDRATRKFKSKNEAKSFIRKTFPNLK